MKYYKNSQTNVIYKAENEKSDYKIHSPQEKENWFGGFHRSLLERKNKSKGSFTYFELTEIDLILYGIDE